MAVFHQICYSHMIWKISMELGKSIDVFAFLCTTMNCLRFVTYFCNVLQSEHKGKVKGESLCGLRKESICDYVQTQLQDWRFSLNWLINLLQQQIWVLSSFSILIKYTDCFCSFACMWTIAAGLKWALESNELTLHLASSRTNCITYLVSGFSYVR